MYLYIYILTKEGYQQQSLKFISLTFAFPVSSLEKRDEATILPMTPQGYIGNEMKVEVKAFHQWSSCIPGCCCYP